jgi:hypothetical protein
LTEIVTTAPRYCSRVAFGLALAFGLGNRELAGQITREWYARFRAESEAIAQDVAERELEEDKELEGGDGSEQREMIPVGDTGEMTERAQVAQRP